MSSLVLSIVVIFLYLLAYKFYGRYLRDKIFSIDANNPVPAHSLRDDIDYAPASKGVLFGHHFTSIAGTGPIVGPAIGIIWGWLPALLWVVFGSIFIGAVQDFATLVISVRKQGKSIGDISAEIVNPRVRILFLLLIFFALLIVVSIFVLLIALLFIKYPQTVIPVWFQVPLSIIIGFLAYRKNVDMKILGIIGIFLFYVGIVVGAFYPIKLTISNPLFFWMIVLFGYAFLASVLPVWILLRPRDFLNAYQLFIALILLFIGIVVVNPSVVIPPINQNIPSDTPVLFPFLFVTIACGAISGFHSLVSSGTTAKQIDNEKDTLFIGYGSMLLEGVLAFLVIICIAAGFSSVKEWSTHYSSWKLAGGLSAKLGAFVSGATNILQKLGIPSKICIGFLGVFIASFAGTTLDTATRIQRYVITEIGNYWNISLLNNRFVATAFAVLTAAGLAFSQGSGKGALVLWPLFGTVNQLIGAIALLVVTVYLARNNKNIFITGIPVIFMIVMTGTAMVLKLKEFYNNNWLLFFIALAIFVLEIWMILESLLIIKTLYKGEKR